MRVDEVLNMIEMALYSLYQQAYDEDYGEMLT